MIPLLDLPTLRESCTCNSPTIPECPACLQWRLQHGIVGANPAKTLGALRGKRSQVAARLATEGVTLAEALDVLTSGIAPQRTKYRSAKQQVRESERRMTRLEASLKALEERIVLVVSYMLSEGLLEMEEEDE